MELVKRMARLPMSYLTADALLYDALFSYIEQERVVFRRVNVASGICEYQIRFQNLQGPQAYIIGLLATEDMACLMVIEQRHAEMTFERAGHILARLWRLMQQRQAQAMAAQSIDELEDVGAALEAQQLPSLPSSRSRARRGPRDAANDWAREQRVAGRTIDDMLPDYARRKRMSNDLVGARELLRKAIRNVKPDK